MEPLLVVIEPGLTHRLNAGASQVTLEHGVGHWTEAIERFGTLWTGQTLLVANQAPPHLAAIDSIQLVHPPMIDPIRNVSLRARSLIVRLSDPLLAGQLGSQMMRLNWEQHQHDGLQEMLFSIVAKHNDVTIFAPTAIPIVAETIIRSASRLQSLVGTKGRLRLRIRFSSQGQERRALDPSYFGLQLRRWNERAEEVDVKFGIEVEGMAQKYSTIAGFPVAWVPWPKEAEGCRAIPTTPLDAQTHIYIYASRPEQGSHHALEIVQRINAEPSLRARFTVQIGRKGRSRSPRMLEKLLTMSNVHVSDTGILPQVLHEQFSDAAVMILPYEAERYRGRGSALMWGALDHGIPLIAPQDTGFGGDIGRHDIGLTYRYLRDIPRLVTKALAERSRFQESILRYQGHRATAARSFFE